MLVGIWSIKKIHLFQIESLRRVNEDVTTEMQQSRHDNRMLQGKMLLFAAYKTSKNELNIFPLQSIVDTNFRSINTWYFSINLILQILALV